MTSRRVPMNLHLNIPGKMSASSAFGAVSALMLAACGGGGGGGGMNTSMSPPMTTGFADTALVSNTVGVVATTTVLDANLQNPWGIAFAPGQPVWIADNNSNLSTLYSGTGEIETNEVTGSVDAGSVDAGIAIPASAAGVQANPTGQIYN